MHVQILLQVIVQPHGHRIVIIARNVDPLADRSEGEKVRRAGLVPELDFFGPAAQHPLGQPGCSLLRLQRRAAQQRNQQKKSETLHINTCNLKKTYLFTLGNAPPLRAPHNADTCFIQRIDGKGNQRKGQCVARGRDDRGGNEHHHHSLAAIATHERRL